MGFDQGTDVGRSQQWNIGRYLQHAGFFLLREGARAERAGCCVSQIFFFDQHVCAIRTSNRFGFLIAGHYQYTRQLGTA